MAIVLFAESLWLRQVTEGLVTGTMFNKCKVLLLKKIVIHAIF